MARTGKQRSLTVTIGKTVAGVVKNGYPKTYYGANLFSHASETYLAIDALKMATMPIADYEARLAAFTAYVENLESGLIIADVIADGGEAYRDNTTACPIT